MAQIKVLKFDTDGVAREVNTAADDLTLNSFTAGSGPAMSPTGIDMNNTDLSEVSDIDFQDPSVSTIEQTAGALVIDNIMAKERENTLTTAAGITFPAITDTAAQVDALRLPALAGAPTATPSTGGEGHMVWDSTNNKLYVWDGASWDDQSTVQSASNVDNTYTSASTLSPKDVVFISAADTVSGAQADASSSAQAVGVATAAASAGGNVTVRSAGIMTGYSALTAGSRYYLAASAAGQITASAPTGAGHNIVQIGFAKSSSALHLAIQNLGRRA